MHTNLLTSARGLRPAIALVTFACTLWSAPAWALRPFNGTDAAVAEQGVFELELGAIRARQDMDRALSAPAFTANYGIAENTELVFDGRVDRILGDTTQHRTTFGDAALSLKHVFREGSLQDKAGPSIAAECGVLLPGLHADAGVGATCAGIVSQRIGEASVHFNAGITRARSKDNSKTVGVIVQAPEQWAVRPVMEVETERGSDGARAHSVLAGVIVSAGKDLALDLAVRRQHGTDPKATELRFGLTWSLHL